MKILVIEDEKELRKEICTYLSGDKNVIEQASTLSSAIEKIAVYRYDCIILDIGLPDGDGFEVLQVMQKLHKEESVIIISARNSLDDKLRGLQSGADDYLIKPFHLAELKARVEAIFRRKSAQNNNELIFNEITIILKGRTVLVNGKAIVLTRKEYDILLYFVSNQEKVISKSALAEHIWGDEMDMHDSHDFIYTHIKNLRKKLEEGGCRDYIRSLYSVGYKFSHR